MPTRVKEKKCLRDGNARIVFAPHPSARSRPCPCPGGSTPRYPAQPRPPSRTLKPVTTAEPRRASLSRFRSFLWSVDDGKRQRLGTARDVFSFGREGWGGAGRSRRRGRARGENRVSSPRATRARSGRTLVRDPASRARARRRPSAFDARRAKNDDADARQRMTFENARRVSRVPSLARPSHARARVRAFRLRCRPNARQPKPARRSHARCATYECRPTRAARVFERAEEFVTPRLSAKVVSRQQTAKTLLFKRRARVLLIYHHQSSMLRTHVCGALSRSS
jgi:hypothetical protein